MKASRSSDTSKSFDKSDVRIDATNSEFVRAENEMMMATIRGQIVDLNLSHSLNVILGLKVARNCALDIRHKLPHNNRHNGKHYNKDNK